FQVAYGNQSTNYVESKESSSATANLYQKSKKEATMLYQVAQEQIKTIFYNDDIVILNKMNFTINSHSYLFVYNQLYSNTEELCLLAVIKAIDISKTVSEVKKQLIYNMPSQIKTVLFDLLPNLLNDLTELIDEEIHFNN
ncbi:6543_t:CDS:2, partial [Gigaspora margarita]